MEPGLANSPLTGLVTSACRLHVMKRPSSPSRPDSPSRNERKTDGATTAHIAERVSELTQSKKFDRTSTLHREIERLASTPSCEGFAAKWQGSTLLTLLGKCHRYDWTKNFGHIARLFSLTEFPCEFVHSDDVLIAHLLVENPEMVDFTLDEFRVENDEAPELENALASTNHLRSFNIIESEECRGEISIARGIGSHHHLKSWHHQTEKNPDAFVPVLEATLTTLHSLEHLELDILCAWTADHSARIARKLRLMPSLQSLSLNFGTPHDLSGILKVLVCPASPLSSLSLSVAPHADGADRNAINRETPHGLINAIRTMPRLESLCVSAHLLPNVYGIDLLSAVKMNCAFQSLELLDRHGHLVELPPVLDYALNVNVDRIRFTHPEVVQAACRALLQPFNLPADVCHEVSRHLMGTHAAPDKRDCQKLLFLSKGIWNRVKGVRGEAIMHMVKSDQFRPKTAAQLMRRHDVIKLAVDYGVIGGTEASWLTSQLPTFKDLHRLRLF